MSPTVSPTSARPRSSLDPRPTIGSLSVDPAGSASRSPSTQTVNSPHSASFTCFEALLLSRIRSLPTRVAPRRRSIRSWVSPPPESSPETPGSLDPPTAPRSCRRDPPPGGDASLAKGPRRPEGLFNPSAWVGHLIGTEVPKAPCRRLLARSEPARTTSRRPLLLPRPSRLRASSPPRSTEYRSTSQAASPLERGAYSHEVSASSTTS